MRDIIEYNAGTVIIVEHLTYNAYGLLTNAADDTVDYLFGYDGYVWDQSTGMDDTQTREYRPQDGNWNGEDWIRFTAGQVNLGEYAANSPTNAIDPSGLAVIIISIKTCEGDYETWTSSRQLWCDTIYKDVSSAEQIVGLLESYAARYGQNGLIQEPIWLSGHGTVSGGITFGNGSWFSMTSLTPDQLSRLRAILGAKSSITFYSCQSAGNTVQQQNLQAMANALGVDVSGAQGMVGPGMDYDPSASQFVRDLVRMWDGTPPRFLTFKPSLVPTPIVKPPHEPKLVK